MQDVNLRHMSVDVNDPMLNGLPLRMEHRESVDSTIFSIQSSKSPLQKKGAHTMFGNKRTDLATFQKFDLENEGSNSSTSQMLNKSGTVEYGRKVVIKLHNLVPDPMSQRQASVKVADRGTQVYSHAQQLRSLPQSFNDLCQFQGCFKQAIGGICDFRVCCSTGCQRQVCQDHIAKQDHEAEDDDFMTRVCQECEVRANRAFWICIFIALGIPLLAAIPAILFYGGQNQQ